MPGLYRSLLSCPALFFSSCNYNFSPFAFLLCIYILDAFTKICTLQLPNIYINEFFKHPRSSFLIRYMYICICTSPIFNHIMSNGTFLAFGTDFVPSLMRFWEWFSLECVKSNSRTFQLRHFSILTLSPPSTFSNPDTLLHEVYYR